MSERFPHDAAYKAFFSDPAKIDVRLSYPQLLTKISPCFMEPSNVFMAFIFWQPSDSSPPLFRPPLSELFSSGVETCLFRQNPSEAFHQVKEGLGGVLLQRRLNAGKKDLRKAGLLP